MTVMLVCIPTNDDNGLDAVLCDHFGSAPYFMLYETTSGQVTTQVNVNAHHSHGTCHPMGTLAVHRIEAVVCRGMGRRAIEMLNADGIKVLRSKGRTVRETAEDIRQGRLMEMMPHEACAGHGGRQTRAENTDAAGSLWHAQGGCGRHGDKFGNDRERGQGGSSRD